MTDIVNALYANHPCMYRQAPLSKSRLNVKYLPPKLIKHPQFRDDPFSLTFTL